MNGNTGSEQNIEGDDGEEFPAPGKLPMDLIAPTLAPLAEAEAITLPCGTCNGWVRVWRGAIIDRWYCDC